MGACLLVNTVRLNFNHYLRSARCTLLLRCFPVSLAFVHSLQGSSDRSFFLFLLLKVWMRHGWLICRPTRTRYKNPGLDGVNGGPTRGDSEPQRPPQGLPGAHGPAAGDQHAAGGADSRLGAKERCRAARLVAGGEHGQRPACSGESHMLFKGIGD